MNQAPSRAEVLELMANLETEPDHVLHVARLALQLFDNTSAWHHLGARDRMLLEGAACLHDIGWRTAPQGRGHHKESARLIRERGWKHFTSEEVELMAQIARYHRKNMPSLDHAEFAGLSAEQRLRVRKLSAFLRIADGLDRRHEQSITQVAVELWPDKVLVKVGSSDDAQRELSAANKKSDLARALFGKDISFELERVDEA